MVDLASLSRDQLEAIASSLAALGGSERLADFICRVSPHHPPPRHIWPLMAELERARFEPLRLCVHMPPRHAKTVTLLHALAWWVQNWPADMNAYISYNDTIALSKSRLCRNIANLAGVQLGGNSEAAGEWTTSAGGGVVAAGAGAGLTGRGFQGLVVVDDPYKNREEADSQVVRTKIWENFNEVVMTRLEGASVVVCHTRWHQDDLIAGLVKQGWDHINLAALAEDGDQLDRAPGEALWPAVFPPESLHAIRSQIGEWSFAALYQGQPRPRGHSLFGPETYHDNDSIDGHQLVIYADPAASEKTTADYGVMMCMAVRGRKEQRTAKVLDLWRGQVTVPEFVRKLVAFQAKHNGAYAFVESVGGFKAVPQLMREIGGKQLRLREDQPKGDKFQRAQSVAAAWNDGRVTVPRSAPWVHQFLLEVQAFSGVNDSHDDQVDCLSGCWNSADKARSIFSVF